MKAITRNLESESIITIINDEIKLGIEAREGTLFVIHLCNFPNLQNWIGKQK